MAHNTMKPMQWIRETLVFQPNAHQIVAFELNVVEVNEIE